MRHVFKGKYNLQNGDDGAKLETYMYQPTDNGTVKSIRSVDMVCKRVLNKFVGEFLV